MSKQIAKLLKADLNSTSNLALIAKMLEKKGRANDTILAHISKKEANLLKELGGSGTVNPETGLLEFFEYDSAYEPTQYGIPESTPTGPSPTNEEIVSQYNLGDTGGGLRAAPLPTTITPSAAETSVNEPSGLQTSYTGPSGGLAPVSLKGGVDYGISPRLTTGPALTAEGQAATPITTPAPGKSVLESLGLGDLKSQDLIRLGLAGGLGTIGYTKSKQAAKQAEQAAGEQKALAAPYQTQGQELIRAAQAGELSPTGQQALQAQRAQLAQGVESRGGVGAQQAAAQVEAFRQQLLQQQYNYGLQIAQVGDSIALGAIKTGLQADQAVNQATQNFYTSLAMVAGGIPMVRS